MVMKNIMRSIILILVVQGLFLINFNGPARAQEDWKQEYSEVCAKTQNAMGLSVDELQNYIDRCNKLLDHISELQGEQAESEKKVFTKRVKMCRDLYDFALKYKEENK